MDTRALCWPESPRVGAASNQPPHILPRVLSPELPHISTGPDSPPSNTPALTPRLSPAKRSTQASVTGSSPRSRKRSSTPDEDLPNIISKYLNGSAAGFIQRKFNAEEAKREEMRRQRSRVHQERHKQKKLKVVTDLQSRIRSLRQEIAELRAQQQNDQLTDASVRNTASEFFRHFRHGVNRFPGSFGDEVQRDFLYERMAPDVADGSVVGVDALLEQWRLVSYCFQDIDIQPQRLESVATHVLVVYTEGTFTINANTLRGAFRHLIYDNEGGERWSPLAAKLLGQQLVVHGSIQFEWDGERKLVTGVQWETNLLTPLLDLLGNLEDVARVFGGAFLTPEGRLSAYM